MVNGGLTFLANYYFLILLCFFEFFSQIQFRKIIFIIKKNKKIKKLFDRRMGIIWYLEFGHWRAWINFLKQQLVPWWEPSSLKRNWRYIVPGHQEYLFGCFCAIKATHVFVASIKILNYEINKTKWTIFKIKMIY